MKKLLVLTIVCSLMIFSLIANLSPSKEHITLLAVSELEGQQHQGSLANLQLEIKPGAGRIFIETFPAAKLDTQISTRLAKNAACELIKKDCSNYDFFYNIRSPSVIVGGPSASAATAILTIAVLENIPLKQDIAITGSLTAGNLIGHVGGLRGKVTAAARANITKVLVPFGEANMNVSVPKNNATLANNTVEMTLTDFGKTKNVTIQEVTTLQEALQAFTGEKMNDQESLIIDEEYQETMQFLASNLCERSIELQMNLNKLLLYAHKKSKFDIEETIKKQRIAFNLVKKGEEAFNKGQFYSSASFCFGANVQYKQLIYLNTALSKKEMLELHEELKVDVQKLNKLINEYEVKTITDLQAYMIVKERLIESNDMLIELQEKLKEFKDSESKEAEKRKQQMLISLGYAHERLQSAVAWTTFFGKQGRVFYIGKDELKSSCHQKLSETEEFYQYIELLAPGLQEPTKKQIEKARGFAQHGDYELCLFKASLAKAQINLLSASLTTRKQDLDALFGKKIQAIKRVIVEQQRKNIFPLLGYSYYEYAQTLHGSDDEYSPLLYAEYALELGDVDRYFRTQNGMFPFNFRKDLLLLFGAGIILGLLIAEVVHVVKKLRK